jgi:hypothetical protein
MTNELEFWRWSVGETKLHLQPDFYRFLRGDNGIRPRLKWSAEYRDRYGTLIAYDIITTSDQLAKIRRCYQRWLDSQKTCKKSA